MAGDARRRSGQGWQPDAYAGELGAGTMPVGVGMTSGSGAMPMGPGLELSHPMHGCSSGVASFVPPALPGQPAHSLRHYGDGMPGFGGSPFARGGRPGQAQQRGGPMGGRAPPTGRHFGARPGGFGIVSSPQRPASAGSMPAGSLGGGMAGYGVAIEEYPVGGEYGGMRPAEQAMGMGHWLDAPEPSGNMDLGRAETGAARSSCGGGPGGMGGMGGMGRAGSLSRHGGMAGGMSSGVPPPGMLPQTRAIFISHVAPGLGYEDVCSAVGAFGALESVKILFEKRQAFVNFVDPMDALALMNATGGQVLLGGEPTRIHWGKARPMHPDLLTAIGQGATRNLYVCNVPDSATEDVLASVFSVYGELESVRLLPNRHAVFANFTTVASAILARESLHGRPKPSALLPMSPDAAGPSGLAPGNERPLHINFTTAQQNCMRARTGLPGWPGEDRRMAWYGGGRGPPLPYGGRGIGMAMAPRTTGRSRGQAAAASGVAGHGGYVTHPGRDAAGAPSPPTRSRGLYLGSLPTSATLTELADLFERYSDVESLRLVRPKSCAFINFFSEETAVAILDRFGGSEATLPTLHGHRITMNFAKARPCSDELLARYRQGARRSLQLVHRRETTHEAILAAIGHRAEMVLRIEEEPGWAEAEEGGGERAEAGGDSAGGGGRAGARQVEETVVTRVDFSSVGAACAAHDILERERLEAVAAHENVMAGGEGAGTPTGEHRSLILRVQFVVLPLKELPPLPQPPAGVEAGGEGAEPGRVGARAGRETPAASDEAAREAAVAMEALSVEEPAESAGGE